MTEVSVPADLWRRFYLERFVVLPPLAGQRHTFTFADKSITVSLPDAKAIRKPNSGQIITEYDSISCNHWHKNDEGEYVPSRYNIHRVDVSVAVDEPVIVPGELLQHATNQHSLVSEEKQTELYIIVRNYSLIAEEVFTYWLMVLRWKSQIGHIGEPEVRYAGQKSGGTALRSRETGHRFWLPTQVVVVPGGHDLVTEEHWRDAQAALSKATKPPVWFDSLFQSEQRLNNLDNIGSILSLAIALEVSVRVLATHHLVHLKIENVIREIIDIANLRAILNRLKKLSFWDKHWNRAAHFRHFNTLMNARDQIMHASNTTTLEEPELRRIYASVKTFSYLVSDHLETFNS